MSRGFLEGRRTVSQVKSKERKDIPGQKNNKYGSASLRRRRRAGMVEPRGRGGGERWGRSAGPWEPEESLRGMSKGRI